MKYIIIFFFKRQFEAYFDLCSCEIYGTKYLLPCNPVLYLNDDYGNWKNPEEKNYTWPNLDLNGKLIRFNLLMKLMVIYFTNNIMNTIKERSNKYNKLIF